MTAAPETVFLIEDDDAVRASIAMLLGMTHRTVRGFTSGEAFLEAVGPEARGCLVLDHRLPHMTGLELLSAMNVRGLAQPVVMITGHGTIPTAVAAFKGGAVDFIEKPFREEDLLSAVERALEKDRRASAERQAVAQARSRMSRLTEREREVLLMVVRGLPNKVVADRLGISIRTVETHRARAMEKLQADSVTELVRIVVQCGDLSGGWTA